MSKHLACAKMPLSVFLLLLFTFSVLHVGAHILSSPRICDCQRFLLGLLVGSTIMCVPGPQKTIRRVVIFFAEEGMRVMWFELTGGMPWRRLVHSHRRNRRRRNERSQHQAGWKRRTNAC